MKTLQQALGVGFCDYYVTSRAWELKAWRETVTELGARTLRPIRLGPITPR